MIQKAMKNEFKVGDVVVHMGSSTFAHVEGRVSTIRATTGEHVEIEFDHNGDPHPHLWHKSYFRHSKEHYINKYLNG